MEATLGANKIFGEQRFSVLSRGLDFCRAVYGSDDTDLIILIAFVCQACVCCPLTDFDWWVIAKGEMHGWYCAHGGAKFVQDPMAGVRAILYKKYKEFDSITRINIPTRKTANVFTMLNWFNFMRGGSLKIARDELFNSKALLIEIRDMIGGDNVVAARAFRALGVATSAVKLRSHGSSRPLKSLSSLENTTN